MWKAVASNALTLIGVILIAVAGAIAWGRYQYVKPGPLVDAVCVQVGKGANLSTVSKQLEEQGAVTDGRIFRIGTRYSDKAALLKHGAFLVEPHSSMREILEILTVGGASTCGEEISLRVGVAKSAITLRELDLASNQFVNVVEFDVGEADRPDEYLAALKDGSMRFRVIAVEGATSRRIAMAIEGAEFLSGVIDAIPAEGSLAPGNYDVDPGSERAALIVRMSEAQSKIMNDLWSGREKDLPYETPEEAMIMASIIEKETSVPDERPLVASVFVNRLRESMPLQTDPTVIYGITKGGEVLDRSLRQSELRRDTPYNTYIHRGLPPTPIANPGRDSIMAALHPAETDYLFFVADGSGGHAFASTLAEHNRNVQRWREIEAQRVNETVGDER